MRKKTNQPSQPVLCRLMLLAAMLFLLNPLVHSQPTQNLLILGDSLSAGYGIQSGKEWSALLSERLKKHHPHIRVINASISGETTSSGLARLPALLASNRPTWVFVALGANDGLRGQSLNAMKKNLNDIIALVQQHNAKPILAGMILPPNYGKVFNARFQNIYKSLAKEKRLPLLPFLLKDVGGHAALMQNDGLHPNEKAQTVIFGTVWQFLSTLL